MTLPGTSILAMGIGGASIFAVVFSSLESVKESIYHKDYVVIINQQNFESLRASLRTHNDKEIIVILKEEPDK